MELDEKVQYNEDDKNKIIKAVENYYKNFKKGLTLSIYCAEEDVSIFIAIDFMADHGIGMPDNRRSASKYLKRLRKVKTLRQKIIGFERKYSMPYQEFIEKPAGELAGEVGYSLVIIQDISEWGSAVTELEQLKTKEEQNKLANVSLDFRLDNLEDMVEFSKSHVLSDLLFSGRPTFNINGFNIFELSPEEDEDEWAKHEVVSWLLWFQLERENYCDPKQYKPNAPQEFYEADQHILGLYEENEDLDEWGDHHVLMHYLASAPYLTLQSPSDNELEIYWNFTPGYIHRKGKVIVDKQEFLREVEKEKRKMAEVIFEKIPELKKDCFFKFLLEPL